MPAYAFPNRQSYDKMARVVRLRDGREGGLRSNRVVPRDNSPRLGKVVTSAIAADSTGDVQPQNGDWTATSGSAVTVTNDSGVELPVGTRVYYMSIAGALRIIWAAVCDTGA